MSIKQYFSAGNYENYKAISGGFFLIFLQPNLGFYSGVFGNQLGVSFSMISGIVTDDLDNPLSGAIVFVVNGTAPFRDVAAVTNEKGRYQLSGLQPGTYEISVLHEFYSPSNRTVEIVNREMCEANFKMTKLK